MSENMNERDEHAYDPRSEPEASASITAAIGQLRALRNHLGKITPSAGAIIDDVIERLNEMVPECEALRAISEADREHRQLGSAGLIECHKQLMARHGLSAEQAHEAIELAQRTSRIEPNGLIEGLEKLGLSTKAAYQAFELIWRAESSAVASEGDEPITREPVDDGPRISQSGIGKIQVSLANIEAQLRIINDRLAYPGLTLDEIASLRKSSDRQ